MRSPRLMISCTSNRTSGVRRHAKPHLPQIKLENRAFPSATYEEKFPENKANMAKKKYHEHRKPTGKQHRRNQNRTPSRVFLERFGNFFFEFVPTFWVA